MPASIFEWLCADDEKVGKPKVSFNLNSNNSDGLDQSRSTSQTYSRQPTSNLRGGGMRLSNSAPRRAASAVYGLLVWIGEQLSLGYTRWDRMRVDNALAGFLLLILALVFVIVIVVPVVIVVGIVFCVLLGVAILTDTLCAPWVTICINSSKRRSFALSYNNNFI